MKSDIYEMPRGSALFAGIAVLAGILAPALERCLDSQAREERRDKRRRWRRNRRARDKARAACPPSDGIIAYRVMVPHGVAARWLAEIGA